MEVGKLYKVDGVVYTLDKIMSFSDGSILYVFSNEEEDEFMVSSYMKTSLPYYYDYTRSPPVSTIWSNEVIPV